VIGVVSTFAMGRRIATGTRFLMSATSTLGLVMTAIRTASPTNALTSASQHDAPRSSRRPAISRDSPPVHRAPARFSQGASGTRGRSLIADLKPHPAMRDSGVEWPGQVPEYWEVRRVKALFRLRIEKSGTNHGKDLLSTYTHIGVRPRKDL
jgi:hypothetical protein